MKHKKSDLLVAGLREAKKAERSAWFIFVPRHPNGNKLRVK